MLNMGGTAPGAGTKEPADFCEGPHRRGLHLHLDTCIDLHKAEMLVTSRESDKPVGWMLGGVRAWANCLAHPL